MVLLTLALIRQNPLLIQVNHSETFLKIVY